MAKKKGLFATISAMGKSVFYKETPQVKGRIGRALAKETKGGTGEISKRPSFKKHLKTSYKDQSRAERGKIVRALAKNTKGGTGKIAKRPAYKQHLPKR